MKSNFAVVPPHGAITDGLKGLLVDEVFDDDNDGDLDDDLSAGSWRVMEERFYQEGIVANLAYKRVTTYANAHSTTVDAETLYYYGYDQVGNVAFISEDTDMSTSKEFVFHQDAFGNEVSTGVFASSSWTTAAARTTRITEHQTGKDFDEFTGLYYFSARWYDPMVGRFVGREPLFTKRMLPTFWEFNPHLQHPFVFVRNNPMSLFDPNGKQSEYCNSATCPIDRSEDSNLFLNEALGWVQCLDSGTSSGRKIGINIRKGKWEGIWEIIKSNFPWMAPPTPIGFTAKPLSECEFKVLRLGDKLYRNNQDLQDVINGGDYERRR